MWRTARVCWKLICSKDYEEHPTYPAARVFIHFSCNIVAIGNPSDLQTSGIPVKANPEDNTRSTKLTVPDTSAYNILFAVNAFLDDLCKVQSALNSLAKEFEKTLEKKEMEQKEKKVPYNTFFDHLELVYKLGVELEMDSKDNGKMLLQILNY
ncbi:hypothetical protein CRE_08325 [Caenorhabditis remanei]|uniref:Uncharacterized protein n=1 Tax=Caenorhabditis remanei TaxID=31234 RepID=E3MPE8_CAERE|nr:hypothetical protein CRE_08325 [Caenorhabditis remanei]